MNDIIFGSTMEETTQKCSEKIAISSNHLLQLVNDVLDMNKISEGKVELTPAIFHLGKMLNTIEVVYAEAAREKNIEFRMDLLSEISPYVIGDELRLKQVLINLISNALKYNKANGKILLQIKQVKEFDGKQKLFFSVIDNGIGISKENLPIVFDAFEREKRSDINAITGSGLGLSISAQIVKLMGSELKVDSELGKGSNFYFTILLPLASEEDYRNMRKEKVETDAISLNGKNILIAEDNTINAEIIKNLLEIKNASVTIAENGEKAVKLFEVSEINYYTVIIMDIRMPIMNGYEATRKIRSLNRLDAKKIPIIALSANAFAEDKLQSLDAGMNEHLSKPIDREEVYRTIAKYLKS